MPTQPLRPKRPVTPRAPRKSTPPPELPDYIYGRHTVLSALEAQQPLNRVWIIPQLRYHHRFQPLLTQAQARGTVIDQVEPSRLDQLTHGANHQGVVAQVSPYRYWDLDQFLAHIRAHPQPLVVLAEGIMDPQNLGAIIRTTEAMGGQGVIIPQRRCVGVTSTVAKVAAGALSHLPVVRVVNLTRALEELKAAGFWSYALVPEAPTPLYKVEFANAVALVVGSEGSGLTLNIRRHCDVSLCIPLSGHTPSLNAAIACGMALYEVRRQHQPARLLTPMPDISN
ncbi:MAG: 23S rRNA (guanosine(2251)-2'-O)-methyltransferase RlmB [Gloeomargarita sp. SKYG116]|nr:23S rRNA (guanosine(2251)-2'-O)-methyltransferase RlmB [Gloeomargarita sp. SKYG116]MCS7225889.1 23S rRNA (guanosine(2251)-2'-O)-methyltransferase RlmB [Gloeomargarita sp. SKYB31]MDW8401482.1 23S rRNA (guanosine(2251)-2'-O)-methyltransferase RlmB [Gloeomargarita sp. SKYGB_i_bin116]